MKKIKSKALVLDVGIVEKKFSLWRIEPYGCRMWLEVERSTITHEIKSVKPCHPDLQKLMELKK